MKQIQIQKTVTARPLPPVDTRSPSGKPLPY